MAKPTYHRSFADGKPSPGQRTEQSQAFGSGKVKAKVVVRSGKAVAVASK